jgi:flagellar biosynthetic protein FliO
MAGLFFRMIISLLLILFLTYYVLKFIRKQQSFQQKQKLWIKILDYQSLGANRGIYLLEIMNAVYVVGASDGKINILNEIDTKDQHWQDIKEYLEKEEETTTLDVTKLKDCFAKFRTTANNTEIPFKSQLKDQLKRSQRLVQRMQKGGSGDK